MFVLKADTSALTDGCTGLNWGKNLAIWIQNEIIVKMGVKLFTVFRKMFGRFQVENSEMFWVKKFGKEFQPIAKVPFVVNSKYLVVS